jgi:P-type Ca2+ transporter type 2C
MDSGSNSSSSPPGQVTTPSTQNPSVSGSNLLNVPTMPTPANHQRNGSFGSSGTSAWTPSPSTGIASSDMGDNKSDLRALIKSEPDEPEIPNNPFAFTPKQMAKLHDPKDLNILRAMGGLDGMVYGLRTDLKTGLSPDEDKLEGQITLQDVWHELETRKKDKVQQSIKDEDMQEEGSNEKEKEPEITQEPHRSETRKSTASRRPTLTSTKTQPAVSKGFSDRKYVFSENRIPARKPKNIFQLMWMALHDKILVYPYTFMLTIDPFKYRCCHFAGTGILSELSTRGQRQS